MQKFHQTNSRLTEQMVEPLFVNYRLEVLPRAHRAARTLRGSPWRPTVSRSSPELPPPALHFPHHGCLFILSLGPAPPPPPQPFTLTFYPHNSLRLLKNTVTTQETVIFSVLGRKERMSDRYDILTLGPGGVTGLQKRSLIFLSCFFQLPTVCVQ